MKHNTMILSLVALSMPMATACGADPYGLTQAQMMQIETTILHQQIETTIMHDVLAEGSGDSLQGSEEEALDEPTDEELKTPAEEETHEERWDEASKSAAEDALELWHDRVQDENIEAPEGQISPPVGGPDPVAQALVLWAERMNGLLDEMADDQVFPPVGGPDPIDED